MSTFFIAASIGLMLGCFIRHSHNEQAKSLARIERQLQAIAAGPTLVQIHRVGNRNINAIKIIKDATGLTLPDTATLLKDTPCQIPHLFTATEAETLVAALSNIRVEASWSPLPQSRDTQSASLVATQPTHQTG